MKRVIVDLAGREHDSTGKSLDKFKSVRGNLFIGDKDSNGYVHGRFGRERFLFTDLLACEILAVLKQSVRTGFGKACRGVMVFDEARARKLKEWFRAGMPTDVC